jgi:hypothetical protein
MPWRYSNSQPQPAGGHHHWRTQEYFSGGGGRGFTPGIFSGGSKNLVADRGQRERGSGGGNPLVRGSTRFSNELNPYSDYAFMDVYSTGVSRNLCHKLFLGIPHPHLSKKCSYQHGPKSEHVPRYRLLCRNPRNAVINISAA